MSESDSHRTPRLPGIAGPLVKGYRGHRSCRVLALMAAGLAFIFGGAFLERSSAVTWG
jgi:hypothetical protein